MNVSKENRPWGFYEVLADEKDHKVKRITVLANQILSLQRHQQRAEHWFILKGKALVTLNEQEKKIESGQAVDIGKGIKHRIKNVGEKDLVFIEVQTGDYFGEDDIERFEDVYGRS